MLTSKKIKRNVQMVKNEVRKTLTHQTTYMYILKIWIN